jgi:uncharacterized protein YndB with AHSA1/START domain
MTEPDIVAEPGKHDIVVTTEFEAPRDLVFRTIIDPDLIPGWWGPARLITTVDKMDARPGGGWRYVQVDTDGSAHAFHGVYHEVSPPHRLVLTFEYEGEPGHVSMETIALDDLDGRTLMTDTSIFQSVEDRDSMLAEGAVEGAIETVQRLAALLAKG